MSFEGIVEDEPTRARSGSVTIFGRPTPVELNFLQVEKNSGGRERNRNMAKKVTGEIKLRIPAGGHSGASCGPALVSMASTSWRS